MPQSPFIESIRTELRLRLYSLQTEKLYLYWIRQFIYFHHKKHQADMRNQEIDQFLSSIAIIRRMSIATQNQALRALISHKFIYGKFKSKSKNKAQFVTDSGGTNELAHEPRNRYTPLLYR